MTYTFEHLDTDADLRKSFGLMQTLRPHLTDEQTYRQQLSRQLTQGYRLLAACRDQTIVGLAGYRELENLLYGRFIYVDDLVVDPDMHRQRLGANLLSRVREEATRRDCDHLVLDTGLHMALAQRFYFRQGLLAKGMHFTQSLLARSPQ